MSNKTWQRNHLPGVQAVHMRDRAVHLYDCAAGRVGFGVDMEATRSLGDPDNEKIMEVAAGALLEADRRKNDPLRKYLFWRKVHNLPKQGA